MKIISWNCNGAFRKKCNKFIEEEVEIMVIQECENPSEVKYPSEFLKHMPYYLWVGDNKNKGLGIFSKYKLNKNEWNDDNTKYFISCNINEKINIIGVWCHHANSPTFQYIGQMWKYLQINRDLISDKEVIIIGDFNSNKKWDIWDRWWNHSDVVNELEKINIISFYHRFFNEEQGAELLPTFYLQKNIKKSYHIDYAFGTRENFKEINKIEIGTTKDWLEISDHMPITIEYKRNIFE